MSAWSSEVPTEPDYYWIKMHRTDDKKKRCTDYECRRIERTGKKFLFIYKNYYQKVRLDYFIRTRVFWGFKIYWQRAVPPRED